MSFLLRDRSPPAKKRRVLNEGQPQVSQGQQPITMLNQALGTRSTNNLREACTAMGAAKLVVYTHVDDCLIQVLSDGGTTIFKKKPISFPETECVRIHDVMIAISLLFENEWAHISSSSNQSDPACHILTLYRLTNGQAQNT